MKVSDWQPGDCNCGVAAALSPPSKDCDPGSVDEDQFHNLFWRGLVFGTLCSLSLWAAIAVPLLVWALHK
jgi:hypothetical protein